MQSLRLLLASLVLAGCSTSPVTESTATPVPPDRVYSESLLKERANTAKVSFFRDSGFRGAGCTLTVLISGERAFALRPAEFGIVYLKPGKYFFGMETGGGLCPNISESQNTILEAGAEETYRILAPAGMGPRLTRVK